MVQGDGVVIDTCSFTNTPLRSLSPRLSTTCQPPASLLKWHKLKGLLKKSRDPEKIVLMRFGQVPGGGGTTGPPDRMISLAINAQACPENSTFTLFCSIRQRFFGCTDDHIVFSPWRAAFLSLLRLGRRSKRYPGTRRGSVCSRLLAFYQKFDATNYTRTNILDP